MAKWAPMCGAHFITMGCTTALLLKDERAEFILNELQNIYTKRYLTFLKYILHIFKFFNELFQ